MQSQFNKALNKEATYYGLVGLGIICCLLIGLKFGLLFGLGGAVPGYVIGSLLSKQIHQGRVQRWIYSSRLAVDKQSEQLVKLLQVKSSIIYIMESHLV